ncbi:putative alpha-glucosidase [Xylariaceae sp. FL0255]|nr:putative alpha-glucosidase [Xylariaceae sp. FL0255]
MGSFRQLASFSWAAATLAAAAATPLLPRSSEALYPCPGYKATNIKTSSSGLTASLTLAGTACNVYGTDLKDLTLTVEYQTSTRLHVIIEDVARQVYQVPSSVFTRPAASSVSSSKSEIEFKYVANPFSFSVVRKSNGDVLFDTSAASMVFESQYLRVRTSLPENPSLYGTGEHTDPFMLNTTNYTRTIWNRDAFEIPTGTNLYGDHPVYYDHRGAKGTHAVFLLNSDGMDIKINNTNGQDQYLEYNVIGGVMDLYFLAGPTPIEVAQQYSEVVGKSALMPYWGLGFHQCRYGMQDVYEVAEVVANYSAAAIPLETMWTDIDYMDLRRTFSLDPDRFPLDLMQQLVQTLHSRQQHYIMMVDPAVAYYDYAAYNDGVSADAFLKLANGSVFEGVTWPGVAVFPDWFATSTQEYWNSQFDKFFDPETGVDIDALWIDLNEASNFCDYPCADPQALAAEMGDPPNPPAVRLGSPRPIPGFPEDFQPQCHADVTFNVYAETYFGENIYVFGNAATIGKGDEVKDSVLLSATTYPIWSQTVDLPANTEVTYQYLRLESDGSYIYENINRTVTTGGCGSVSSTNDTITTAEGTPPSKLKSRALPSLPRLSVGRRASPSGSMLGLSGRDLINPPYTINNAAGSLSDKTLNTDLIHENGLAEYDTHNLFGAMMSEASRVAMLSRRPTLRPMVITRSTFAGSGRQVGHWLGDNVADWAHYLSSIGELLEFGALYQVPMVGSDVCGYADDTNDKLCARWATLGAFSPFYRNHEQTGQAPHEFYRWGNDSIVAVAARNAIATRYQLLDYIYTALYQQNQTGTPLVQPMFFVYPSDANANALAYQYFYGPAVLVAPVTQENSTTTRVYYPKDMLYDFYTGTKIEGVGSWVTLTDVAYTTIPLYYKGGSIVPLRVSSSNTTAALRKVNFELVIAPAGTTGLATGSLYLDDGVSIVQKATSVIHFTYEPIGGVLTMSGTFGYDAGVHIESIKVLGGRSGPVSHQVNIPLTGPTVTILG